MTSRYSKRHLRRLNNKSKTRLRDSIDQNYKKYLHIQQEIHRNNNIVSSLYSFKKKMN